MSDCAASVPVKTVVYGPEIHVPARKRVWRMRTVHSVLEAPMVRNARLVPVGVAWLSATCMANVLTGSWVMVHVPVILM